MEEDKIVYQLTVEDLQNVAIESIDRELTNQEIKQVEEKLGDFIDWFGAISGTINYLNIE
jgi:hypothetical protein